MERVSDAALFKELKIESIWVSRSTTGPGRRRFIGWPRSTRTLPAEQGGHWHRREAASSAAGGLRSPVELLLRSGIRPTAHVADHRIEMQADRPGRGTNLQDRRAVGPAGLLHRSAGCRTRSSIICRCCCATHPTWKACRRAICISTDRSAAIKQLIMTFGVGT